MNYEIEIWDIILPVIGISGIYILYLTFKYVLKDD